MKIGLKKNETKAWLDNEIRNKREYLTKLGPGEEYSDGLEELKQLIEMREDMKLGNKLLKGLPFLTAVGAIVAAVGVPIYGMNLTYKKQEVENELPNGDIKNLSYKNMNTKL